MSETNPEVAQVAAAAARDRRTRRRLLAGAAGALGVAAAGVVSRPGPAQALDMPFMQQSVDNGPTTARTAAFTSGNGAGVGGAGGSDNGVGVIGGGVVSYQPDTGRSATLPPPSLRRPMKVTVSCWKY